jgi:hypothetical protein
LETIKYLIPFIGTYNRKEMFIYGFSIPLIILFFGGIVKEFNYELSLYIVFFGLFLILSGIFKRSWNMGVNPFLRILLILIPVIGIAFYAFLFLDNREH